MVKIFPLGLLLFFSVSSFDAQENNFFQIKADFYLKHGNPQPAATVSDDVHAKFARWEQYWQSRVDSLGNFPNQNDVIKTASKVLEANSKKTFAKSISGNWIAEGPFTTVGGYSGIGRLNCMAFDPSNPAKFWLGSPAGGLWLTEDGGQSYIPKTDNLPVIGVSDIAIHPFNSDTMYIASGDALSGSTRTFNGTSYGDTKSLGVMKSVDGGNTWSATGLTFLSASQAQFKSLLIHPTQPNILLAFTSRGIFKTVDSGVSWVSTNTSWIMDAEFNPETPSIVYATKFSLEGYAQFMRSDNLGDTWTNTTALSNTVRIEIAVTPQDANRVDIMTVSDTEYGLKGLFRSEDAGITFNEIIPVDCATNNYLGYNIDACNGQGYYSSCLTINPLDSNEMWIGGVDNFKSTDKGLTWEKITNWYDNNVHEVVHADKHFFEFHPILPNLLYSGNDGGLYKKQGTQAWTDISNSLQISQIYRIGVNKLEPNNIMIGLQDNGTKELKNGVWQDITGGDGMECMYDKEDPNIAYSTSQNGSINRTLDGWNSSNDLVDTEDSDWITIITQDPMDSYTVFTAGRNLFKSTDNGDTWAQLTELSGQKIQSIEISESNNQVIYLVFENSIKMSSDGGVTWVNRGNPGPYITSLVISKYNSNDIWVTCGRYDGTVARRVFKSTNGGYSWSNISGTLPNMPVNCSAYQAGNLNRIYVGTDLGIFYRNDTMSDWISYGQGLPNVPVAELEIDDNAFKIWAGTFGRGLWSSDLFGTAGEIGASLAYIDQTSQFHVYPNPSNGIFTVAQRTGKTEPCTYLVTDANGRTVAFDSNPFTLSTKIDLSSVSPGVYFIEIKNNFSTAVTKIIIR